MRERKRGRERERKRERPGSGRRWRRREGVRERPEAGEAHYRYCCNKPSNNSDKYEREAGVTNVSLSYDYLARSRSLIRPLVRSFVASERLLPHVCTGGSLATVVREITVLLVL